MPDFEILWGEWGHIELKSWLDRPSGTFCLYGGPLRPVVGCFQGGNNIWKGFNEPYPTPIHRITLLGSIFVLSVYIFRVAGVNRRLLGQIQAIVAGCPLQ